MGGWGIRVDEVGPSLDAAHGAGSAVVRAGGLLRCVEGAEPPPLFGLRVTDFGGVTAPGAAADATVPHGAAGGGRGGGAVFMGALVVGAALWGGGGVEDRVGSGVGD